MSWGEPRCLLLLWLLPALAALLWFAARRRSARLEQFYGAEMRARLQPAPSAERGALRAGALLLGLGCLIAAAARPRFGVYFEDVPVRGADLVVCLDVSRSMLAGDVAPNRLERAKSGVLDLLAETAGDRVGLVAFAGRPVTACPLTTDQGFFRLALAGCEPGLAPRGGSLIGDAVRRALELLPRDAGRDQAIVLITDGEDQESAPLEAAAEAAERGVKIFAVGIGDAREGARIPATTAAGENVYLKHEGQEVWSRMDEALLQEMALRTGGAYVPAATRSVDLGTLYRERLRALHRGAAGAERRERQHERYQWFAGAGLLLLALWQLIPSRPKSMLWALALLPQEAALDPAALVREGVAHYQRGAYPEAAGAFRAAAEAAPDDPRVAFNRGLAELALQEFPAARAALLRAATAPDPRLALDARYNLGVLAATEARSVLGDAPEALEPQRRPEVLESLAAAGRAFQECLRLDPARADARYNLELVRRIQHELPAAWRLRDLAAGREGKDALAYLTQLQDWQERLRDQAFVIGSAAASPLVNERWRSLAGEQRELSGELQPLLDKLAETLAQAGLSAEQAQAAAEAWEGMAGAARQAMAVAAEGLQALDAAAAHGAQARAAAELERLYRSLAPFEALLQRGIAVEKELVSASETAATEEPGEPERLLERQRNVGVWCQLLALQARQRLEAAPPPAAAAPDVPEDPAAADPSAVYRKALELAPQAEAACAAAAAALETRDFAAALAHQRRALELLEQIAAAMPQQ